MPDNPDVFNEHRGGNIMRRTLLEAAVAPATVIQLLVINLTLTNEMQLFTNV